MALSFREIGEIGEPLKNTSPSKQRELVGVRTEQFIHLLSELDLNLAKFG